MAGISANPYGEGDDRLSERGVSHRVGPIGTRSGVWTAAGSDPDAGRPVLRRTRERPRRPTAASLGLAAGPIEGPTHFSQFDPLLVDRWGERWFSHGCLSAHFQTMVVEGEQVRATVTHDHEAADRVTLDAAKADGTPVLTGSATVGPNTWRRHWHPG
ncbi:MAG: hypothetical protein CM1200mP26_26170 [Acidimicrobiales bacterium]|nr:MAG: hypothetical protein CM1200mP26_26170 [Acidimicrobiales bacterium]